LRNEGWSIKEG